MPAEGQRVLKNSPPSPFLVTSTSLTKFYREISEWLQKFD